MMNGGAPIFCCSNFWLSKRISYIFQKLVADEQGIQVIIEAAQNYRGYGNY